MSRNLETWAPLPPISVIALAGAVTLLMWFIVAVLLESPIWVTCLASGVTMHFALRVLNEETSSTISPESGSVPTSPEVLTIAAELAADPYAMDDWILETVGKDTLFWEWCLAVATAEAERRRTKTVTIKTDRWPPLQDSPEFIALRRAVQAFKGQEFIVTHDSAGKVVIKRRGDYGFIPSLLRRPDVVTTHGTESTGAK